MALVVSEGMASVLTGKEQAGRITIDAWGLGVDCKRGVYDLNLYSQGSNYPEIIADTAVAGVVALLTQAKAQGVRVSYWPGEHDSVLFVGQFNLLH